MLTPMQAEAAVKINKSSVTLIKGQTVKLKITGTKKKITWSSNKKAVATVNSDGKVIARKKGTAKITARVGNKKYTCKITVQTPSISKKSLSLYVGKTAVLKMNGTDQKVIWKSSANNVASVNKNGKILAKSPGTATITAVVLNKKYPCKVTVKAEQSSSYDYSYSNSAAESSDSYNDGSSGSYTDYTTTDTPEPETSDLVWITTSGKKYHNDPSCSNMKSPYLVSLSEAIASGRDACKKCYG